MDAKEKQRLFWEWLDYAKKAYQPSTTGRYAIAIQNYLDSADAVTEKSVRMYRESHIKEFIDNAHISAALHDFLSFHRLIRKKPKKIKDEKTLEKLEVVNERNRQQIDKFCLWLPTTYDYSIASLRNYKTGIEQFFKYCNDFSYENAKLFINTLKKQGKAPETITLRTLALNKYSEFIKKPLNLKPPKISSKLSTENIPSLQEYQKLLEYLRDKNRRYYFYIKALGSTGMRISEITKIHWEDIIAGHVDLQCKGNKYRRIYFPKSFSKEVSEHIAATGCKGRFFLNRFGEELTSRGFDQMIKSYGKACGIDKAKMHAHAFRHFFAKQYLKSSKDVIQLADILGHESVDTTRLYLQKNHEEQKRDFNRFVTW